MNERIKRLAEQASRFTANLESVHNQTYTMMEITNIYNTKFAELIVRECLKIVEPTEDSGDEWCVTLKGTAQEIKEHFGVKE